VTAVGSMLAILVRYFRVNELTVNAGDVAYLDILGFEV